MNKIGLVCLLSTAVSLFSCGRNDSTKYNLKVNSEDDTKGSVSGGGQYSKDQDVTISAVPNPNYSFMGWYDGSSVVSTDKEYTFKMPGNDLNYTAKFAGDRFALSLTPISAKEEVGGTVEGAGIYEYNSTVTCLATPKGDYSFAGWYYLDETSTPILASTNKEITFGMINSDLTLYAYFEYDGYCLVTFDNVIKGASHVPSKYVESGKSFAAPSEPIHNDYYFIGWYKDKEYKEEWKFDTDKVKADTTLYAKWTIKFSSDSWSNVINYADQGLEKLHEVYAIDCDKNTEFPGTLIGLVRKTELFGVSHRVRVIDEAHDDLVIDGNDGENKATLTFEFVDLVTYSNGTLVQPNYHLAEVFTWNTSNFKKYLATVKNKMEFPLGINIKKVKKTTYDPSQGQSESEDYLFPLSIYEMSNKTTEESNPYAYYAKEGESTSMRRIKKSVDGTISSNYWTRTTWVESPSFVAYTVSANVGKFEAWSANNPCAFAPAFCIGATLVSNY